MPKLPATAAMTTLARAAAGAGRLALRGATPGGGAAHQPQGPRNHLTNGQFGQPARGAAARESAPQTAICRLHSISKRNKSPGARPAGPVAGQDWQRLQPAALVCLRTANPARYLSHDE